MKRLQNPVSKRNNVIDLRFVLPHSLKLNNLTNFNHADCIWRFDRKNKNLTTC